MEEMTRQLLTVLIDLASDDHIESGRMDRSKA